MKSRNTQTLFVSLILILLNFSGCSSLKEIEVEQLSQGQKISRIILVNDNTVDFSDDPLGYAILKDDKIERLDSNGNIESYNIDSVKHVYLFDDEHNNKDDLWMMVGVLSLLVSVIVLARSF